MRSAVFIITFLASAMSYASEPTSAPTIDLSQPEIRRIIREEALKLEHESNQKRYVIVTPTDLAQGEPLRVFGFTEEEALLHSGEPSERQGAACSSLHKHGDLANRWCHAYFADLTDKFLLSRGFSKGLSLMIAASIFIPKEYLVDKKASPSDIVTSEIAVYDRVKANKRTSVTMTAFGDGVAIISLEKQFD